MDVPVQEHELHEQEHASEHEPEDRGRRQYVHAFVLHVLVDLLVLLLGNGTVHASAGKTAGILVFDSARN
ncbi:MAG: hypothetical protein IT381_32090 [Deltaproteobacteria bacterium]|nr:hypothetical protein [Deltaproteobacteria bacterium]